VAPVQCRSESVVEGQVVKWCVEQGIICFKFTPQGRRGWPDRQFICEGRVAFIEFKAVGDKPRPLQAHCLRLLNDAGIPAIWSDNFEESIKFLQNHFDLTNTK
jgi:hypothetical protein